ncbi:hypothetical protein RB195_006752 [Necator americanus]|uniref:Uncharacterized protein n=1 Tax=Necator americanus TaxID=51031 RepID=A0ABR1BU22_NECAM
MHGFHKSPSPAKSRQVQKRPNREKVPGVRPCENQEHMSFPSLPQGFHLTSEMKSRTKLLKKRQLVDPDEEPGTIPKYSLHHHKVSSPVVVIQERNRVLGAPARRESY